MPQFARSIIVKAFGNILAKPVRIMHVGSVKPNNIGELM